MAMARVLVVDDDQGILDLLSMALSEAGFEVDLDTSVEPEGTILLVGLAWFP